VQVLFGGFLKWRNGAACDLAPFGSGFVVAAKAAPSSTHPPRPPERGKLNVNVRSAQKRWRALNGSSLIPDVITGVRFVDGVKQQAA